MLGGGSKIKRIGEADEAIRVEVHFPKDLTDEEIKELDKDIKGRLSFYREKVAAFRAARSKRKLADAQIDALRDGPDNRAPPLVCLLTLIGTLLSLSDCLI